MLELIILSVLGRHIAERARGEGKSGIGAVLLLLALWFVGSAVAGLLALAASGSNFLLTYCGALLGGIAGARAAFAIVAPNTSHAPPVDGPWRGTGSGRRRRLLVIVAVLGAAAIVALCYRPPGPPAPPADLVAVQGEWVQECVEVEGVAGPSGWAGEHRATITGDKIRFDLSEAVSFHIDPESPPGLDIQGPRTICAYQLEGNWWVFCVRSGAPTRPSRLETRPGSKSYLYVYRRRGE